MSDNFEVVRPGSGVPDTTAPATPRNVPHRGGMMNPTAEALRLRFPELVQRAEVVWGETSVFVERAYVADVIRWLHDEPTEKYDMLVDVTAVEQRDLAAPIEVVWHLRSLAFRRFLRIKTELKKGEPLQVPSVWGIYRGADWLERECYDMFGIRFDGHPDLRRILLWEQYKEGYPLRKDFPLRGRFSRGEQLKQALAANPEARYSMEELSVIDAFEDLPIEMQRRLAGGERPGE